MTSPVYLRQLAVVMFLVSALGCTKKMDKRPNILFFISDDQSFIHTSIQGTRQINTPHFDRIAKHGILFNNAYCNASSCAPSRASILTGRNIWELGEGGLLFGALPERFISFTHLLAESGYDVGRTGKGYGPANLEVASFHSEPVAPTFNNHSLNAPEGISDHDYAKNFNDFFIQRDSDKPFFFWCGTVEPHRSYKAGIGAAAGKDISKIEVPGFLPDHEIVRSDIADYYFEIEWMDTHLGRMLQTLELAGELDNTIVIITSDNGMPFPRAKTTCYDFGTHLPLAIQWGDKIKGGYVVDDFISFIDFAPTILEAAGIDIPVEMSGSSFLKVMLAQRSGQIDSSRNRVFTALERHTYCRPDGMPYPIRSIRKGSWLYLVNLEADRWPAGNPDFDSPHQGFYGDVDRGPTRAHLIANQNDPFMQNYFEISFSKRPPVELYNVVEDPFQLHNLATNSAYADLSAQLRKELFTYLAKTGDPRMDGSSPWDNYPYFFNGFADRYLSPIGSRDNP